MEYKIISIHTNENARWEGKLLSEALLELLRARHIAARCLVTRGIAGCDENGEISSQHIELLSYNLPIKIEIVLPAAEVDQILPQITARVSEGVIGLASFQMIAHKMKHYLIPRRLKVQDAMTPRPQRAQLTTPLQEVLETLLTSDFTGLPIVDAEDHPVGIITDGDLLYRAGIAIRVRLLSQFDREEVDAIKLDLAHTLAQDIMSSSLVTVGQEQYLTEAVEIMRKQGLRRLPVVDHDGKLVGILARLDIFRAISLERPATRRLHHNGITLHGIHQAGDVMSTDTPPVLADTPLEEVIKILGNSAVERVAVVDSQGKLLGLISDRAMLAAFSQHKKGVWEYLMRKISLKEIGEQHAELIRQYESTKAGDVMETDYPTATLATPLDEAVDLMITRRVKRIPVVDEQGRFLGMLRRERLLRLEGGGTAPGRGGDSR
ncbi:MAG: DUF190 domain-containing protein [Deltaproteobacteria bacterium]|nr:DUF190 domain-containing protein [Deltaproteobacteria bacterium]